MFALYIPIWFYSNVNLHVYQIVLIIFTFQSGSIQIISGNATDAAVKAFTFQSGSIQMKIVISLRLTRASLHSNLVLFKYLQNLFEVLQ